MSQGSIFSLILFGDYNLPFSFYSNQKMSDKTQALLTAELQSVTEARVMICNCLKLLISVNRYSALAQFNTSSASMKRHSPTLNNSSSVSKNTQLFSFNFKLSSNFATIGISDFQVTLIF